MPGHLQLFCGSGKFFYPAGMRLASPLPKRHTMQTEKQLPDKQATATQEPADSSSAAAVERGRQAIKAHHLAVGEDENDPAVREAELKDAEKWRNEG